MKTKYYLVFVVQFIGSYNYTDNCWFSNPLRVAIAFYRCYKFARMNECRFVWRFLGIARIKQWDNTL
jgi:hypothetical protein